MKNLFPILFVVLLACSSTNPPEAIDSDLTVNLNDYKLIWNDEFNGKSVDTTKWNYRAEGTVRNYGIVSRESIELDGHGHVVIKVTKDRDGKYYIGELGTQGIFETTYGYFECRAKMNQKIGAHVAFWLQSPTLGKTGLPAQDGAEIDIFEYHRKTPSIVYHNLHWGGYGINHKTIGASISCPDIDTSYHTFGLKWTKENYIFYIDGKKTWTTTTAISQRSEYLILSTELTGWGGDPSLSEFPDSVLFDYVRVYKSIKS
jgi:beta-glucanase (GH16 family)